MNTHLSTYLSAADRLTAVVGAVAAGGPAAWSTPTPCTEWSSADLLGHLIDTQRDFLLRHDLAPQTEPPADAPPEQRWTTHLAAVTERLGDGAVLETEFEGWFGPTTIGQTLTGFYAMDMIVHRWDLSRANAAEDAFSEAEMDLIEATIAATGETLYSEGICAAPVPVDPGASRQDRVLGQLGRDPGWHSGSGPRS